LGLHRRSFLFKVRYKERPTSTTKETFGVPIDLGDCVFGYGDCRPEHDIPDVAGKVSDAAELDIRNDLAHPMRKERSRL